MLDILFEVCLISMAECSDHHFLLALTSSNLLRHIWLQECPDLSQAPIFDTNSCSFSMHSTSNLASSEERSILKRVG